MANVKGLSDYERRALHDIHEWKNPKSTWFRSITRHMNVVMDKGGDAFLRAPGIGGVITKSTEGLLSVSNDLAQWSVRQDAIFAEYRKKGHPRIHKCHDVLELDLEQVDKVIGFLAAKYKASTTIEGGATGLAGWPGLILDVPAVLTLCLRAVGEYATYCGFDISTQEERRFALCVLQRSFDKADISKAFALAELTRIARDAAARKAWRDLEKSAFVVVVRQIAKSLGIRLTKAKLAQIIPLAGALVGGGFNAYFSSKVCDAAFYLYRERFIALKHNDEGLISSVPNLPCLPPPGRLPAGEKETLALPAGSAPER